MNGFREQSNEIIFLMLKNEYGGKNVVKNPKIKVIPLGGLN